MPLKNTQIRYLRGLAHDLKPVILIGGKGVTDAVVAELDSALAHHELVKVKVAAEDRESRDEAIAALAGRVRAEAVQKIGHTVTLYRKHPENPRIELPR